MKYKVFLAFIIGVGLIASGCGGVDTANVSNANVNTARPAENTALDTVKKPESATTNNAPTLTPTVHSYYEALKKKDDALLKSVMSADFIKSIETDMKADKKTGFAAYMAETEVIPEKPVEVRNEKIEGNSAVAEVRGGVYLNWTPLAFTNEGGKWKFTGGSPILK